MKVKEWFFLRECDLIHLLDSTMFLMTHTACSNNQSIISSQSYNTINTGSLQPSSRHSNNSAPIPDYGYQSTGPSFYTNTANTSPNDYVSGKDIYSRLAHKTHLMHLRQWRQQTLLKIFFRLEVISLKTHEIQSASVAYVRS